MVFLHNNTSELVLVQYTLDDCYIIITEHSVTAVDRNNFHLYFTNLGPL